MAEGEKTRKGVPVLGRGVAVVLLRRVEDRTEVLVVKRAKPPAGIWCKVSGKIKRNETAWQAALREVREETNLAVGELYSADWCEIFYEIHRDSVWVGPMFVAYVENYDDLKIAEDEHVDHRWVSIAEAIELLPFPGQKLALEHVNRFFVKSYPSPWLRVSDVLGITVGGD